MIKEFIFKYYIDPIRYGQAYTWVDTLTYAIILILCVWLIYRWLLASHIPVDREFVYGLIPWIVLGGFLRVVEDTGMITGYYRILFTTPFIFFMLFGYAAIILIISQYLSKHSIGRDGILTFRWAGVVSALAVLGILCGFGIVNHHLVLSISGIILCMAAVSSLIVYCLIRYGFGWTFAEDKLYQLLIFSHMLDASATSYGIDLHDVSYVEQHVVGSTLISLTGTAFVMFPLKLMVIIPGIYILELYRKEGASGIWYLILLAMIMVGLAPGIRDMMRMVLYV